MSRRILSWVTLLAAIATGCSPLMGGLRRDLNDEPEAYEPPVTGGMWPERGFLAESMPEGGYGRDRYASAPGGRGIASVPSTEPREGSWVNGTRLEQNQRDAVRVPGEDGDSYSENPNNPPPSKKLYKNGSRATRADFVDDSQNEGSLWASDGQTNYFFTKNKVRGVGDIINLNLENEVVRDIVSEIRRTLTAPEKAKELSIAQDKIKADTLKKYATTQSDSANRAPASSPNPNPSQSPDQNDPTRTTAAGQPAATDPTRPKSADEIEIPKATMQDVDLKQSLEIKEGDNMLGEIVERYPNGNYKIRATKRIPYKNGAPRLMTVVGIVKGSDISEDGDLVKSSKLYEYRLEALR